MKSYVQKLFENGLAQSRAKQNAFVHQYCRVSNRDGSGHIDWHVDP
jgi:hypothetical protein